VWLLDENDVPGVHFVYSYITKHTDVAKLFWPHRGLT